MANTQNDVVGYDLSSTGVIVEINASGAHAGWNVSAGSAADFDVQIKGRNVGWTTIESYSSVTTIDDGKVIPEAVAIRVRNTSTVADTADVMLGVDN